MGSVREFRNHLLIGVTGQKIGRVNCGIEIAKCWLNAYRSLLNYSEYLRLTEFFSQLPGFRLLFRITTKTAIAIIVVIEKGRKKWCQALNCELRKDNEKRGHP
jgi:hypothetical protein